MARRSLLHAQRALSGAIQLSGRLVAVFSGVGFYFDRSMSAGFRIGPISDEECTMVQFGLHDGFQLFSG